MTPREALEKVKCHMPADRGIPQALAVLEAELGRVEGLEKAAWLVANANITPENVMETFLMIQPIARQALKEKSA